MNEYDILGKKINKFIQYVENNWKQNDYNEIHEPEPNLYFFCQKIMEISLKNQKLAANSQEPATSNQQQRI